MSKKIEIMPMKKTDLNSVIEIGLKAIEFKTGTNAEQFYRKKTLQKWVKHKHGIALTAKLDGKTAGFVLGYYMQAPNDGYINFIEVKKEFQSLGIGGRLLEEAIKKFEQMGSGNAKCNRVFLVSEEENKKALSFFKKHGFQTGKKFYYIETMLPRKKQK